MRLYPKKGWKHLHQIFENIAYFGLYYAEQALDETSSEIVDSVKTGIRRQSFPHVPLSRPYLQWKEKEGLDLRILVATKEYVNALEAPKPKQKRRAYGLDRIPDKQTWEVGPPEGYHSPSGMTYSQLAATHEFGVFTRNIPPRPHWRPSFQKAATAKAFLPKMHWIGIRTERRVRTFARRFRG